MPIIRRSNCVPLPTVVCPVVSCCGAGELGGKMMMMMIIIIIVIFINCNWVVTRWQWLFYMYTNMKKKVSLNILYTMKQGYSRQQRQTESLSKLRQHTRQISMTSTSLEPGIPKSSIRRPTP